ncbi:MAG: DUF4350 domain-containing protein [Bacteroidetes bacterium]|nr:DUF4350 domain-containing protein [Bacteroidota bacterium]
MKGYKFFVVIFISLTVIYIIAQYYKPHEFDWTLSLEKKSKEPYGTSILFDQLHHLFPEKEIQLQQTPIYNVLHDQNFTHTGYLLIEPEIDFEKLDIEALLNFVKSGNTVFIAALSFGKAFSDSLHIEESTGMNLFTNDSIGVNFTNPTLRSKKNYYFDHSTVANYFKKIPSGDTARILGVNSMNEPDFIQLNMGSGKIFLHISPICFSNYFMLKRDNAQYTSIALSYLNNDAETILWDEYYKSGREGATTPLRFFLDNEFLKWALWLSIIAMLIYVFVEIKRKQRIIPLLDPLRNTTIDFVQTVAGVYLNKNDHRSIAQKKIAYWLEFIRNKYFLSTQKTDDFFVIKLNKKSGIDKTLIQSITGMILKFENDQSISREELVQLSNQIDEFYNYTKIKK